MLFGLFNTLLDAEYITLSLAFRVGDGFETNFQINSKSQRFEIMKLSSIFVKRKLLPSAGLFKLKFLND